jgi:hypothetical protein
MASAPGWAVTAVTSLQTVSGSVTWWTIRSSKGSSPMRAKAISGVVLLTIIRAIHPPGCSHFGVGVLHGQIKRRDTVGHQDIKERETRDPGQPCRLPQGGASRLEVVERRTHPHLLDHILGLLPQRQQQIIRDLDRDA